MIRKNTSNLWGANYWTQNNGVLSHDHTFLEWYPEGVGQFFFKSIEKVQKGQIFDLGGGETCRPACAIDRKVK